MTLVLLASVSLCALVVASPVFVTPSTALQAAFHIHSGKDVDPVRFPQQIEHVSLEDVAAIVSFPGLDTANELRVFDDEPAASVPVVDEKHAVAPLVVLAFSCLAAFLTLACIALMLYIIKSLRSQMLASKAAWELLPRFWRRSSHQKGTSAKAKKRVLGTTRLLLQPGCLLDAQEGSAERHGLHVQDKPSYADAVSDMESDLDDVDEKYQDALDTTPLAFNHDLPHEGNVSRSSHFDDPPLPPRLLDQPTTEATDRSTPLMHELHSPPASRPAWSVRAIDSPALGLSMREGDGVASTPPLIHPRRRAYRAVPEFDVALAMQLRPGLGIGADSAWMVRFLMTIFGWFAVALTGNTR